MREDVNLIWLGAPSCRWIVRFLWTVGIAFADSMPAGPRAARSAPVDSDFRGLSAVDDVSTAS